MGLMIFPGERWDQVSQRAYGITGYEWDIIFHNRNVVGEITWFVTREVEIVIPEIVRTEDASLPPWRRQNA